MKQVLLFAFLSAWYVNLFAQQTDSIVAYKKLLDKADYYHSKVEEMVNVHADSAHLYLDSVVTLFWNIHDTLNAYATDHVNRAKILIKQHRLSKAILLLEEYIEYARVHHYTEDVFVYIETGNIYFQLNLPDIAQNYYLRALRCRYYDMYVYPVCLNNLGLIFQKKKMYNLAQRNFLRTYYFRKRMHADDAFNPLYSIKLLAENANMAGRHRLALYFANKGCVVFDAAFKKDSTYNTGKQFGYADLLLEKIKAYAAIGQTDSAYHFYRQAARLLKGLENTAGGIKLELTAAETWLNAAQIHMAEQCLQKLEKYALPTLTLTDRIQYCEIKKDILKLQGKAASALPWELRGLQLKDSLIKLNGIDEILEFNTRIVESQGKVVQQQQAEKLEQREEIIVQEKNNRKGITVILILLAVGALVIYFFYRKSETDRKLISKQNKEKELLIREIHHRVKNNLTVITGILDLQERSLIDSEMKLVFRDAKSRVNSMALVHKNLYEQENLGEVNTQMYFENLCRTIYSLYNRKAKSIEWFVNCNDTILNTDSLVPLALITNELLTNSFKYAFEHTNQGEIHIDLHKENAYIFQYRDNGCGIKNELTHKGLGTQLVQGLSKQLNGSCVQLPATEGVHYEITFEGISNFS